jgi:hypothetical protein
MANLLEEFEALPDAPDATTAPSEPAPAGIIDRVKAAFNAPADDVASQYASEAGAAEAGIRGAAQTMFLGNFDEAAAGLDSLVTGRKYDDALTDYRGRDDAAKTEHPGVYNAAKVPAGVALQAALATATGGASLTPPGQAALGAVNALGESEANRAGRGRDRTRCGTRLRRR